MVSDLMPPLPGPDHPTEITHPAATLAAADRGRAVLAGARGALVDGRRVHWVGTVGEAVCDQLVATADAALAPIS
ncbi:hypothetical protein ACQPZQ_15040 [Pseudonocardia sp. CA-142604]|uniref:hypothetical protein n=1 Tax=Pseudonocardia sp. CA-142604 TaxID=3240024 RepID=UPI003D94CB7E